MNPLIDNFSKILKPCSGCGKDLSDPSFDQFWKPKEKNAVRNQQANSSGSGDARGSGSEDQ
jgi:hypothetical protein